MTFQEWCDIIVKPTRRRIIACSFACIVGLSGIALLSAQQPLKPPKAPQRVKLEPVKKIDTTIVIEVLSAQGAGINAREWSELFQALDVQFTIRRALGREEPETTEQLLGTTLRDVRLVGRLERDGSITFADRHYSVEDAAKIREWIADIKLYGAQGTPRGQAMWGLTKAQFEPLFLALAPPVEIDLADRNLDQALQAFTVRKQYPLRISATAVEYLKKQSTVRTVQNHYTGLSEGTVLSAMLNEFGLGFHPRRTPEGKLELGIVKLGERVETWPAGWPPTEDLVKLRPVFFQTREVELIDEPLLDVVQAIGDIIELPVLVDESGLKAIKVDVRTKKVSHKKKTVILSAALKHICYQGKCKYEFRMDEGGKPLLWLTPEVPAKQE